MKSQIVILVPLRVRSPPARGAWIEIKNKTGRLGTWDVAPRTGGVD